MSVPSLILCLRMCLFRPSPWMKPSPHWSHLSKFIYVQQFFDKSPEGSFASVYLHMLVQYLLTFRYGNAKCWRKIKTIENHGQSHFLCIQLFFLNIFQFQKKTHFIKIWMGWSPNPFRIPYFTFLANLTTNKFEEKYGYIRVWVWQQFVLAGIVLTNVQGRQAILTKCHPDNMSS